MHSSASCSVVVPSLVHRAAWLSAKWGSLPHASDERLALPCHRWFIERLRCVPSLLLPRLPNAIRASCFRQTPLIAPRALSPLVPSSAWLCANKGCNRPSTFPSHGDLVCLTKGLSQVLEPVWVCHHMHVARHVCLLVFEKVGPRLHHQHPDVECFNLEGTYFPVTLGVQIAWLQMSVCT